MMDQQAKQTRWRSDPVNVFARIPEDPTAYLLPLAVVGALIASEPRPLASEPVFPAQSAPENKSNARSHWLSVEVARECTVCQKLYTASPNACAPAVFLNALRFGPPDFRKSLEKLPGSDDAQRLAAIIDRFGREPSVLEPERPLFTTDGVLADDLPYYFNAILKEFSPGAHPVEGAYFDKTDKETPDVHLRRIHGMLAASLARGVPVITSVRSFASELAGDHFSWVGVAAHVVLIIGVPRELDSEQQGFPFSFVEPSTGAVREGYVHAETVRGFTACKGGGKDFKWIDRGFLQVVAPSLNLETSNRPWFLRSFITLNYGAGAFEEKER